MRVWLALVAILSFGSAAAAGCNATSGNRTAALVELYTSEGCSNCPAAERWLSSLAVYPPERVVPIALHVDYWDYIGWKDRYAQRRFALRQRRLALLQHPPIVYTPQILLQGQDFRGWGTPDFDAALAEINTHPARARISLEIESESSRRLAVRLAARLMDRPEPDAVAYLAAYESRLRSHVTAGENRGRMLSHDFVVLEWIGPLSFSEGRMSVQRDLALLPGADPAASGIVAFIQKPHGGEVLQALMLPACGGTFGYIPPKQASAPSGG